MVSVYTNELSGTEIDLFAGYCSMRRKNNSLINNSSLIK